MTQNVIDRDIDETGGAMKKTRLCVPGAWDRGRVEEYLGNGK